MRYKNTFPHKRIVDLKEGRRIIGPGETINLSYTIDIHGLELVDEPEIKSEEKPKSVEKKIDVPSLLKTYQKNRFKPN